MLLLQKSTGSSGSSDNVEERIINLSGDILNKLP